MKKLSIPDLKSDIFNKIDEYLLKKKFKKSNIIRKSNLKDLIFNIISILSKNPLTTYFKSLVSSTAFAFFNFLFLTALLIKEVIEKTESITPPSKKRAGWFSSVAILLAPK